MSAINKYLVAVAAVIIPFSGWIVGFIVSPGSPANDPWFNSLIKPSFNPPAWIFAPVWTFIYCSIGIASYLVYAKLVASGRGFDRTAQVALASYVIQLALNWAWPPIFFKYHLLKWSTYEIIVLLIAIILNGYIFGRINKIAGALFIPYVLWSSFATYLNCELYRLNG